MFGFEVFGFKLWAVWMMTCYLVLVLVCFSWNGSKKWSHGYVWISSLEGFLCYGITKIPLFIDLENLDVLCIRVFSPACSDLFLFPPHYYPFFISCYAFGLGLILLISSLSSSLYLLSCPVYTIYRFFSSLSLYSLSSNWIVFRFFSSSRSLLWLLQSTLSLILSDAYVSCYLCRALTSVDPLYLISCRYPYPHEGRTGPHDM